MFRILEYLLRLLQLIIMHSSTSPIALHKGKLDRLHGPVVQKYMPHATGWQALAANLILLFEASCLVPSVNTGLPACPLGSSSLALMRQLTLCNCWMLYVKGVSSQYLDGMHKTRIVYETAAGRCGCNMSCRHQFGCGSELMMGP